MIHNIHPYQLDISYQIKKPKQTDYVICGLKDRILLKQTSSNTLTIPQIKDIFETKEVPVSSLEYLISVDQKSFFAYRTIELPLKKNLNWYPVYYLFDLKPHWLAFSAITSSQLYRWLDNRKYCGHCGNKMQKREWERAMECPACGNIEYPKISPVIMVGVINDEDEMLLTKYAQGRYRKESLVAGYVEIGETLEQAAAREVMEETGIQIKELRYFTSQPWGMSDSIMIGFFAKLKGDSTITLDENELSEGYWVARHLMPTDLSDISIAYEMMEAFRNNESITQY